MYNTSHKQIKYIIDANLFPEYEYKLTSAIKTSGMLVYSYDPLKVPIFRDFLKDFTNEDIIMFYGCLQHGITVSKSALYPGTFFTPENYECYNYYGLFGDHMLNRTYLMMGLNDLERQLSFICSSFPNADKFFIRPSNGIKTFAGQLIHKESFSRDLNILTQLYGGVPSNTLVLIAEAKTIFSEYRFVIIDGEVISGATYFDEENIGTLLPHYNKICTDSEVIKFAKEMAKIYQPDKAFTLDIARTSEGIKVLELNSFNCASLYGNDYLAIIQALNTITIKEYKDLWE